MRLICCDLVQMGVLQIVAIFVFVAVVDGQGKYKRCDSISANGTPTPGQCIEFPLCPRLLEFAKRSEKSLDDFRVLRKLTCGFYKDKPRVCCPDEDIYHPPPADDNDYSNFPLQFPKEGEGNDTVVAPLGLEDKARTFYPGIGSGSPSIDYSKISLDSLIPKIEDCGEPRFDMVTSTRIIGGANAEPGQFPYMALLYRIDTETDEEEYYCAGTIINQFYILTAAHCVLTNQNTTTQLAFILVGITDVSERCQKNSQSECRNERRYEVKQTVVHPKYVYGSRDKSHDIALVRTSLPIELNKDYIRPVCLPIPKMYGFSDSLRGNSMGRRAPLMGAGVVAGWGRQANSGPQNSPNLKSVILPILSKAECQQRYAGQVKISEKQICAGGELGRDTCVGDSGGPLLTPLMPDVNGLKSGEQQYTGKMFQTGIISFGPALCATTGKPSVYTNVISYIDWILDNMYL